MDATELVHESKSLRITKGEIQFDKKSIPTVDILSTDKRYRSKDLSASIALAIVAALVASGILVPASEGLLKLVQLVIAAALGCASLLVGLKAQPRYAVIIRTSSDVFQIALDEDEERIDAIVLAVQSTLQPPAASKS